MQVGLVCLIFENRRVAYFEVDLEAREDVNLILVVVVVNWRYSLVHDDCQLMMDNALGLLVTWSDVTLVAVAVVMDVVILSLAANHNEEDEEAVEGVLEASSGAKVVC